MLNPGVILVAVGLISLLTSVWAFYAEKTMLGKILGLIGVVTLPVGIWVIWDFIFVDNPQPKPIVVGVAFAISVLVFVFVSLRNSGSITESQIDRTIKKLGGGPRTVAATKVGATVAATGNNRFTIQAHVRHGDDEVELGALMNAAKNMEQTKLQVAAGGVLMQKLITLRYLWRKGNISDENYRKEYKRLTGDELPLKDAKKIPAETARGQRDRRSLEQEEEE